MFAGAAFTDSADIKVDTEVVDTLVALGVVNGYDDGSFKPNGTVTRAEMAKMIYVLRTGNSDASAYNDDKTSFTDIGSHWARGYIKYCQSLGIIAGKSNTKFCPNDKVTAQEAAKMLLVTLCYDAANAGLTGPSWAAKTNALADENGLLEDVNTSFTAACPRQYAAQLIYNTIDTPTVVWRDDAYTNVTLLGTDNKTVGEKYMGLQKWIGTFEGDSSIVSAKDGEITVNGSIDGQHKTITNSTSQVSAVAAQFKADFDNKYVGEEVSVLFKDGNTGTKNQPDAKDTIFGIYVTGNTKVYNIVKGDLQSCSDAGKIKFNDKKYDVASFAVADSAKDVIINNYGGQNAVKVDALDGSNNGDGASAAEFAAYINNAANGLRVKSNDAIKFVTNEDNKIVKAYVTTSKFGKVSSVTSSKIGVEGLGTKDLDDCVVYDGIKAGDLVQYVEAYQSSERKNIITKAETVEGKIEAFKSSDSQIRVNGNWYKFSANTAVATNFTNSALTANDVDDTYELIVDGKYYVAYNKVSGFNDYAVATRGNTEFGDTRVKLLKADGSEVTSTVDEQKDGATLPSTTNKQDGKLYAYNLKSSDSKVDLSAKDYTSVTTAASGDNFNGDAKTVTLNGTRHIVANDASIFVYVGGSDNKWKVYTAKDLGNFTLTASQTAQYIVDDNKIVALAVKTGSFPTGGSDSTAYGYVTNRIDTKLGDDTVVQLTIWNGSEEVTLNVDGSTCSAYRGDFVEYPIIASDAKANNSDVKVEPAVSGTPAVGSTYFQVVKVKSVEDKRIITTTDTVAANGQVVDGVDTAWTTTSDTVKIGVNTDDKEKSDNNTVVAYTKTFGDDYANAAIFYEVKSGYNEIKAIFIDSDNKLQSYVQDAHATSTGITATYAVTTANVTTAVKGLTATVSADKAYAKAGDTVTVTVTVSGTATAAATANVSGVTVTALNAVGTMTNATVNGTTGINVTTTGATDATFTFTFTMGAAAVAPVVTIA